MIYTVTLNPSLDYLVRVADFRVGSLNRTMQEEVLEGGKGINVSVVLNHLGVENVAMGFLAGFTGDRIEQGLHRRGCCTDFIRVQEGITRINIKLSSGEETEINGRGPRIDGAEAAMLFEKLKCLRPGDTLVLAGSVPESLPSDIYADILRKPEGSQVRAAVDPDGAHLREVLKYRPFLIKPNQFEIGQLLGTIPRNRQEAGGLARVLHKMGARNVLISMAGEGAVFLSEYGDLLALEAPRGTVVCSVGAGDSMVAGFLAGYTVSGDYRTALRMGVAAGSAGAFSPHLPTKEEILEVLARMGEAAALYDEKGGLL